MPRTSLPVLRWPWTVVGLPADKVAFVTGAAAEIGAESAATLTYGEIHVRSNTGISSIEEEVEEAAASKSRA